MRKQGSGIAALLDESPKGRNKGFGKKSMDANESEIHHFCHYHHDYG